MTYLYRQGFQRYTGSWDNVSVGYIRLWEFNGLGTGYQNAGSCGWKIYVSYMPHSETNLYMAMYDGQGGQGTGNRMTSIDTQYMSLYNNDVGSYNNNVNYVRLSYYNTGNAASEGGFANIDLHNAQQTYLYRDSTTDKRELSRGVCGTFVHGHNYQSDYQMTDVGSFNHESSVNAYSSTYFPYGVQSLGFYMGTGNISGTWQAFPIAHDLGN